jgi:catechol 2,3-dioxygenase-like lactoylglutathione lyase family enzyme
VTSRPRPTHLLETALYVDDMERAVAFYREVVGLELLESWDRGSVLAAGPAQVLLLFRRGATAAGAETPAGRIPPHDGAGPVHLAFAVEPGSLPRWAAHLAERGVEVESRVDWRRGGTSLYFRDPDGHSVEIATPGVWPVY